jgi:hypothetical protein
MVMACSMPRNIAEEDGRVQPIATRHRKAGAGDAIGKERWSGDRPFEKSAHLLVELPVKKAFLSTIQANLSSTPFLMRRYSISKSFMI